MNKKIVALSSRAKLAKKRSRRLIASLCLIFLVLGLGPANFVGAEDFDWELKQDDVLGGQGWRYCDPPNSLGDFLLWGQPLDLYRYSRQSTLILKAATGSMNMNESKKAAEDDQDSDKNKSDSDTDKGNNQDNQATKPNFNGLNRTSEYPLQVNSTFAFPALAANSYAYAQIPIENISEYNLKLISVILDVGADSPFQINQTRVEGYFFDDNDDDSRGGIYFPSLYVKPDAPSGKHEIKFTVRFKAEPHDSNDFSGPYYEQTLSYFIEVVGKDAGKTAEDIRELLAVAPLPTQMASYGGPVNLRLGLINRGFDAVDVISVTPQVSQDVEVWPFEIEKADYSVAVGRKLLPLSPKQENGAASAGTLLTCDFGTLRVRKDIASGYKPVTFTVRYKYGDHAIKEAELVTYLDVAGNPAKDAEASADGQEWPSSKPRLMCTGYETDPEEVVGGEPFKLTVHLKNTSRQTGIQNIRVNLSSDPVGENAATPLLTESGASSVFIPWIGADTEEDLEVMMVASAQVPQRIYSLKLDMEYEDGKASPIQANEGISIPIRQEVRVDFGAKELIPPEVKVGQETNLMFQVYNKGKTTLYNVSVVVPEGQGISANENFLGNMTPGASSQVDMMIRAEEPAVADEPRKLLLTYEDEGGNKSEKEIEVPLIAMEEDDVFPDGMPPMDGFEGMDDLGEFDPEEGVSAAQGPAFLELLPIWAWALILLVILIIVGKIIISIRRKRRKKRIADADAEYFRDLLDVDSDRKQPQQSQNPTKTDRPGGRSSGSGGGPSAHKIAEYQKRQFPTPSARLKGQKPQRRRPQSPQSGKPNSPRSPFR